MDSPTSPAALHPIFDPDVLSKVLGSPDSLSIEQLCLEADRAQIAERPYARALARLVCILIEVRQEQAAQRETLNRLLTVLGTAPSPRRRLATRRPVGADR